VKKSDVPQRNRIYVEGTTTEGGWVQPQRGQFSRLSRQNPKGAFDAVVVGFLKWLRS